MDSSNSGFGVLWGQTADSLLIFSICPMKTPRNHRGLARLIQAGVSGWALALLPAFLPVELSLPLAQGLSPVIAQSVEDQRAEADRLLKLGIQQFNRGERQKALQTFQREIELRQVIGDKQNIWRSYGWLGSIYLRLDNYQRALELYQQALLASQSADNLTGKGNSLNNIGGIYFRLGEYNKALDFHQQALAISREIKYRSGEGQTLGSIGRIYSRLGEYNKALDFHQQALTISREIQDRRGVGDSLNNIGFIYDSLGEYNKALDFYQQALTISREIQDRRGEGKTLNNLGAIYDNFGEYNKALDFYQQALTISREIQDRPGESVILNNIGSIYNDLGEYNKALDFYQQALTISREIRDRPRESISLNNIGFIYDNIGEYNKALDFYQQSLTITRKTGDKEGTAVTLHNIGLTWKNQEQTELAMPFFKQSVNEFEVLRKDLRTLDKNLQESFTKKVEKTYRTLADLLLEQGRILEAQQVLELLKVQEIRTYTRNVRAVVAKEGIQYTPIEQKILDQFDTLIVFGQKVSKCITENCPQKSQLNQQREKLNAQFNSEIRQIAADVRKARDADPAFYNPQLLSRGARKIVEAQPKTMLIYPLVLEDKLWLLWVGPGGFANRIEVPVTQKHLGETAVKFRQLLDNPGSDIAELHRTGQQLHQWLIKPLETELNKMDEGGQPQIQNLVFSLDRVTRYLPMAALHDGQQYLIEKYQIHTILSAELTDVASQRPTSPEELPVLALGLSEATPGFNALTNVNEELDVIVQEAKPTDKVGIFPGQLHLNQGFNFRALADNISNHGILHIATHGKFEPGLPDASYLVMGNGERLNVPDINTLSDLNKIHLAVLSACETALGGPDAEGLEISGLSYYFTVNDGAKAVMASLWLVNDTSTSKLMQRFYTNLAQGTMTKAEALRRAQRSLLNGYIDVEFGESRSSLDLDPGNGQKSAINRDTSHPYYWAPFIIIGNGL